jgi:N-acetylglucosamine-6-sulfatase
MIDKAWLILCFLLLGLFAAPGRAVAGERLRVVMLGDSLTAGGAWSAYFPGWEVSNQGVSGDSTTQILARLDEVVARKPEVIFLLAGINDFWRPDRAQHILKNQSAIWDRLRSRLPGVRLVVISLLPVDSQQFPGWNQAIVALNSQLAQLAAQRGLDFLNLHPQLLDDRAQLKPAFTHDGLHLTRAAYEVWAEQLRSLLLHEPVK